jgi:dihydroxyacetone kinase DhaKLM complex PTS-EIIA-like component DhaM
MKDKTDSLQSKLSNETIIESAIDPVIEHEHSVSKQEVCKESNELSCGDDRMITKMKDKTDSLQSKLSDETIIEFAIDPAIEHENSVSKQEVCKESNELSCGDDRMITKMKDKTDSLQSKLSDETIIEFAIDPAIEHEHSVSKQGVCKESNELSCGDDRMITKMKDKTDSLQSKLSDETIIEFAIDPAIEHENSVSKQEVCKESNELSCGDDRMTCKSQIIKDEHSKTEKENNNSDILNELLAKEGISSNKKSKKLFDIFFSFFNENENDLLSLKKENNKLKERIKVLSRENDFKIFVIFFWLIVLVNLILVLCN